MSSLKQRIYELFVRAPEPMSAEQIAKKMRVPVERVTTPVSRLAQYGHIEVVRVVAAGAFNRRYYKATGKPLGTLS